MNRRRIPWVAMLALLSLVGLAEAAPEDVTVGAIRAVAARDGSALRAQPNLLAPRVGEVLIHGTRLTVQEVRGLWLRVTSIPAAGVASATGWIPSAHTVAPYALVEAGQRGPAAAAGAGGNVSARVVSAAGRQLTEANEMDYRNGNPNAARAYPFVEQIERASRTVDEATIDDFIRAGRLGRP